MENIKNIENILKKIIDGEIESYTTQPLNGIERKFFHNLAETFGLQTKSLNPTNPTNSDVNKKIIIISLKNIDQTNKYNNSPTNLSNLINLISPTDNSITRELIDFFSKYTSVPIPCNNPEYIDYYLRILSKYYDTNLWTIFIDEINANGFEKMKKDIFSVKNSIINEIKNNSEYQNNQNNQNDKIILENLKNITTSDNKSIYNDNNVGKYFVSIDIISANFSYLKYICPSIKSKWVDMVKQYTESNFIANSKPFREIIFGQLGNKKIQKGIQTLIEPINSIVNSKYTDDMIKKVCSNDEIIYEISKDYDITQFVNDIEKNCPLFSIYRIEKFTIEKLNPYQYYVKNKIDLNKIEFKCIPKKHIIQCIKYFENDKTICLIDRKFNHEGEDVTIDQPLFI